MLSRKGLRTGKWKPVLKTITPCSSYLPQAMLRVGEMRQSDPVDALRPHVRAGKRVTVHELHQTVATDPGHATSGSLVERLCGQPEQNTGRRASGPDIDQPERRGAFGEIVERERTAASWRCLPGSC
jgi:hypothetical protein